MLDFVIMLSLNARCVEVAVFNKDREYWLKRLDALPSAPELPLLDNFSNDNVRFERNQFMIGKHEWDRFCDYARATGITPAAAVMAVYAAR